MNFTTFNGTEIDNVEYYVNQLVANDPTLDIAIGCDSKQLRHTTQYAVVIVMHSPTYRNGAHVIFSRFVVNKVKDQFKRLWKECEYIQRVAEQLHSSLTRSNYKYHSSKPAHYKLVEVHLDLNPNALFGSNNVYVPAVQWFKGMGYKTLSKPNAYASSSAADILLKK